MVSLYVYAFGGGLVSVIGSFIWFGVPWWYYLLLALAVIGAGYYLIRKGCVCDCFLLEMMIPAFFYQFLTILFII